MSIYQKTDILTDILPIGYRYRYIDIGDIHSPGKSPGAAVRLHLVNDYSQGSSSPLSSVTGRAAIELEDQLLTCYSMKKSIFFRLLSRWFLKMHLLLPVTDCFNDWLLVQRISDAVNHNSYVSSSVFGRPLGPGLCHRKSVRPSVRL